MRSTLVWMAAWAAASLGALPVGAQQSRSDTAPPPEGAMHGPHWPGFGAGPFGEHLELLGFGGLHGGKVVTGRPFSAVANGEMKQTLSDGTVISHKFQSSLYRDAQGRVRREVNLPAIGPLAASGAPHSFIVIHDPVAQTAYILNPERKVARKVPPRHAQDGQAAGSQDQRAQDVNVKTEPLGTQTVNGVSAEGTRYTRTIPAGQIGNDKALVSVREEWYSPDLQMVVQSKRTDPFMGDATYSVTNIQRTAPNATLFSVPADYEVKDTPPPGKRGRHGQRGADGASLPPDGPKM
jgi:hypothetical protein